MKENAIINFNDKESYKNIKISLFNVSKIKEMIVDFRKSNLIIKDIY